MFLYVLTISSYRSFASPSYARLRGASTFPLTSARKYHVVNHLEGDVPLPPVDPLTPVLPEAYCALPPGVSPPSTTNQPSQGSGPGSGPGFPDIGSYTPSPPVSSSSGLSPPSTTTLSPPGLGSGSPVGGSYTPSPSPPASSSSSYPTPPASSSSSYPTPPASSSSSYPTYPTPPSSYSTPYTPPSSTTSGPPAIYEPGPSVDPPYVYEPSPPTLSYPSPTGFIPAPPLFEPPVVYPPPMGPPPPAHSGSESALWCVAKPSVPDPIIQEAMNYACGSGADCESLQPNGECFQPDTLFAHASYAFNSYWQRTKVAGGNCEFGGSAMLVTVDPSYDGCHFIYY
nr:hypothetical protein [Tanacetum cinerariifolium]